MRNKKRLIILLAVILVATLATYKYIRSGANDDPNFIRVSGNIEITDAEVSFKIPGRVEARLVSEGELIKTGQLAARLDSTDLAQEVALRGAEVQAAEAALAELEAGSRPEEIAQAEAAVRQAQALMSTFFFYFPAVLLSGFMFPIANMPEVIQWLTYLNPLRYFLVIIRGIFLKGVGPSILWPQMVALTVMGLITLWLASRRFQKTLA